MPESLTPTELHEAAEKLYAVAPEASAGLFYSPEHGWNCAACILFSDHAAAIITTAAMEWAEKNGYEVCTSFDADYGGEKWHCVMLHADISPSDSPEARSPHSALAILAAITAAAERSGR